MKLFYKDSSLIKEKEIKKINEILGPYLEHLKKVAKTNNYDFPESSINLPFDKDLVQSIEQLKKEKITDELKYIIDIGIGGSSLGTKAIYDALYGYFDLIKPKRFPKIIFIDTNDPKFLESLENFLKTEIKKPSEIIINTISKSGSTTETIVNLEILEKSLKQAKERLVITTDFGSKLWHKAEKQNISRLAIPKQVGGRYSVFSSVGLFPLIAMGLNINELLNGAQTMREKCLEKDVFENPAALSAIIIFLQYKQGKNINDNFFFHPELESLGKWYRQLMGESIGKEKDIEGRVVNVGITPTVSIGSTDLHSMGQLYLGGPKDKFTTFIGAGAHHNMADIPCVLMFPDLVEGIECKSADEIMKAILEGVKIAYKKRGLPFIEAVLSDISLHSLGQFLQFKMIEMMFLGKLLRVNAFNQPNVESYKTETKRILRSP